MVESTTTSSDDSPILTTLQMESSLARSWRHISYVQPPSRFVTCSLAVSVPPTSLGLFGITNAQWKRPSPRANKATQMLPDRTVRLGFDIVTTQISGRWNNDQHGEPMHIVVREVHLLSGDEMTNLEALALRNSR